MEDNATEVQEVLSAPCTRCGAPIEEVRYGCQEEDCNAPLCDTCFHRPETTCGKHLGPGPYVVKVMKSEFWRMVDGEFEDDTVGFAYIEDASGKSVAMCETVATAEALVEILNKEARA